MPIVDIQFPASVSVASLTGSNGFAITSFPADSGGGSSVSNAGDINGDGIADLIIGAIGASSYAGAGYVLFGQSGIGGSGSVSISSLTGSNGFAITGFPPNSQGGWSVSGAGDVNGDGIADLCIGAPTALNGIGISYVLFGEHTTTLTSLFLLKNQLTLNENQTITLSSQYLNVTNPKNPAKDATLQFTLNGVQHGRFYSAINPDISLIYFSQQQVQSHQIQFVHDGSPYPPSYNVSISYGRFATTAPQAATITFHQSFVLVNNLLTINQGQILTLTAAELSANDLFNAANNPNLIFPVTNVQHGFFALSSAPTMAITRFTQAQVQNRAVQFIHDNSISAPSYSVTVINGATTLAAQAAVISFDAMPIFTKNYLTINQGQTVVLTADNLSAVNPYDAQAVLTFVVSQIQYGYFSLQGTTTPIKTFALAQIQNGSIQFVHDGSVYSPSYSVTVSDDRLTSAPQVSTISFDAVPVLTANQLRIDQGQTIVLSNTNLNAFNPYNPETSLIFTVSNIQHSYFTFISAPSTAITTFTQTQIQNGQIQFFHDNSVNAPSYTISVSDGRLSSLPQSSSISFDAIPIFLKNSLIVNQGQTIIMTSHELNAINPYDSTAPLTFTVNSVQHGHFELVRNVGIAITTFTLQQIQNNEIQFVQDGTPNAPSYSISVSDGRLTSPSQAATISFDVPPILINNNLTVNSGQTAILTSNNLSASHPFASATNLIFTISDITHGYFELITEQGVLITRFSQAQVQEGQVRFVSDKSNKTPTYKVNVSDGRMTAIAGPQAATVTFRDTPVLLINQLRITQGETVIMGNGDLSATDQHTPIGNLIFSAINVQHGYFEDSNIPGIPTTVFAQQKILSGIMKFVTDGSSYPPDYNISVGDGVLSSPSRKAIINFTRKPETPTQNDPVHNAIIGGVVSGIVGLFFLALKLYLEHKATRSLHNALEGGKSETERRLISYQKEIIKPIANKVFDRIKTTQFLGYRSDKATKAYLSAIESIIIKLSDLGVDLDLSKMSTIQQNKLLNEIAKQTRLQVVSDYSCCSRAYICSFFKPEATPQQLEDSADVIAAAVQAAMRSSQAPKTPRRGEQKEPPEEAELHEIVAAPDATS